MYAVPRRARPLSHDELRVSLSVSLDESSVVGPKADVNWDDGGHIHCDLRCLSLSPAHCLSLLSLRFLLGVLPFSYVFMFLLSRKHISRLPTRLLH